MKKRTTRTTGFAIAIVAACALIIGYALHTGAPPKDFLEARIHAIGAANNLAQLVNNSIVNLQKVDTYVRNNNDVEAQNLISFEFSQKQDKQNAAVLLATYLDQMSKAVPDISSNAASQDAVQAITSGIAMVSRIISYNSDLEQLFTAIQYKLVHHIWPTGVNVTGLTSNLNADGEAVNGLSKDFNAALARFDAEYGMKPAVQ